MDVLFMITHDANFNTAVQALILIYQVANAKQVFPILSYNLTSDRAGSILSNSVRVFTRPTVDDIFKTSTLSQPCVQILEIRYKYRPNQVLHQKNRAYNLHPFSRIYLWSPLPPLRTRLLSPRTQVPLVRNAQARNRRWFYRTI